MKIIANRQLHGIYGTLAPDQIANIDDEIAAKLLKAGLVRKHIEAATPEITSEKPVIETTSADPEKLTKHIENKKK